MVFLFIFLLLMLMVITINIKFEFFNFNFTSKLKNHLDKNYKTIITVYTFKKIPILKIKIDNKKIKNIIKNKKVNKIIQKQTEKFMLNQKDIDIQMLKDLKNIKVELEELNLKIFIGTENAAVTAFIIPVISTIFALILTQQTAKPNDKKVFEVSPVYVDQNLINIEFSGIFQVKMIHIINTICILNERKR